MIEYPWQTDFQDEIPVQACVLCGAELYPGQACWQTEQGVVCTRCIRAQAALCLPIALVRIGAEAQK